MIIYRWMYQRATTFVHIHHIAIILHFVHNGNHPREFGWNTRKGKWISLQALHLNCTERNEILTKLRFIFTFIDNLKTSTIFIAHAAAVVFHNRRFNYWLLTFQWTTCVKVLWTWMTFYMQYNWSKVNFLFIKNDEFIWYILGIFGNYLALDHPRPLVEHQEFLLRSLLLNHLGTNNMAYIRLLHMATTLRINSSNNKNVQSGSTIIVSQELLTFASNFDAEVWSSKEEHASQAAVLSVDSESDLVTSGVVASVVANGSTSLSFDCALQNPKHKTNAKNAMENVFIFISCQIRMDHKYTIIYWLAVEFGELLTVTNRRRLCIYTDTMHYRMEPALCLIQVIVRIQVMIWLNKTTICCVTWYVNVLVLEL